MLVLLRRIQASICTFFKFKFHRKGNNIVGLMTTLHMQDFIVLEAAVLYCTLYFDSRISIFTSKINCIDKTFMCDYLKLKVTSYAF